MDHKTHATRFVVGQHVFARPVKRTAQLMAVSSNGVCTVRFHDDGSVALVQQGELRIASWDEIRNSGPRTRIIGQVAD